MMAMANEGHVVLGFVEKVEPWRLFSQFFPHKIGGKPAWLALDDLPAIDDLRCGRCGEVRVFLMQLYSPLQDLTPSAFHRTLYVFICRNPECCDSNRADNLAVFRSQLPMKNTFYPDSPPNEDDFDPDRDKCLRPSAPLCAVCGCLGKWKCGKCKEISYCSQGHQKTDWKTGHKQRCGKAGTSKPHDTSLLFPEYNLIAESNDDATVEEEEDINVNRNNNIDDLDDETNDANLNEARMSEYREISERLTETNSEFMTEELERIASDVKEDKQFTMFKKILEKDPEQVVRFQLGGQPLWVSSNHVPRPSDIPPCEYCHNSRRFEFQVLSTLLNHLQCDHLEKSIDWGTLAIYTCSNSCIEGGSYGKEFIWKQDFDS